VQNRPGTVHIIVCDIHWYEFALLGGEVTKTKKHNGGGRFQNDEQANPFDMRLPENKRNQRSHQNHDVKSQIAGQFGEPVGFEMVI
jgi:hypothetical protein